MLRQIHIFLESKLVFVKNFAMAFGSEELDNVKKIIQKYIDMPIIGKTFQRHLTDFQIFHRASDKLFFLFITDLVDSIQYIEKMIVKTIEKFKQLFPDPIKVSEPSRETGELNEFLSQLQKDLHSKIAIIGPTGAGKTTLYDILKSGKERIHMDFAKTSTLEIDHVCFDIWDFQLKDNFSLLWSKFIGGSDLVIFLFNLANYNLKMINHFLKLHLIEGKNSKLLMIGNKRDLIEDSDMKLIKNELGFSDFEEMSLKDTDVKSKIEHCIVTILNLRKKLPSEFIELVKQTDNLVLEGKKIEALANYKELLITSKSYQNIKYTKSLEQKIENLNQKIQAEIDKRKEVVKKRDFDVLKPLIFTRKVSVKSLPESEVLEHPSEIKSISEGKRDNPSKPMKGLISFQKFEAEKDIKPPITQKSKLKIIKPISIPKKEKKESKSEKEMPMELFGPNEELKQDIKKPLVVDFTKELQNIIIQKGSSLSLKLCNNLITELEKSLRRDITIEDIKLAADFFVKQEKMSQ